MIKRLLCLSALFTVCAAAPALASPCQGKAPAAGAKLEGAVLHVEDGQRLCIAKGPTPDKWTELQVLQVSESVGDAQIAKAALMNATFSKKMSCVVTGEVDGHAVARCTVDKTPVSALVSHADPVQVAAWMSAPSDAPTRLASAN